jgi:hypothetical protein
MVRKRRIHDTETDKAVMWDRWQQGDSLEKSWGGSITYPTKVGLGAGVKLLTTELSVTFLARSVTVNLMVTVYT